MGSANSLPAPRCLPDLSTLSLTQPGCLDLGTDCNLLPQLFEALDHRRAHGGGGVGVERAHPRRVVSEPVIAQHLRNAEFGQHRRVGVAQIVGAP